MYERHLTRVIDNRQYAVGYLAVEDLFSVVPAIVSLEKPGPENADTDMETRVGEAFARYEKLIQKGGQIVIARRLPESITGPKLDLQAAVSKEGPANDLTKKLEFIYATETPSQLLNYMALLSRVTPGAARNHELRQPRMNRLGHIDGPAVYPTAH